MLIKILKWPVISLLITGAIHFTLEAVLPDLKSLFIPSSLANLFLAYGFWVGYKTIHFGGNYLRAILAAIILGILPFILDTLGFGMILGRGLPAGTLAGVYGFSMILFGSLIGSAYVLSRTGNGM